MSNVIKSDDSNAIEQLNAKLESLLQLQEYYKSINAIVRSTKIGDAEKIARLETECKVTPNTAYQLLQPDFAGRVGIPSYKLTNNNGMIKNVRDRIAKLEKIAKIEASEELIGDTKVVVNPDDNRVQIFFSGKPDEVVRTELKSYGFKWAPSVGAWQRMLGQYSIDLAKRIVTKHQVVVH